jgi:hypothetical protein
VSGDPDPIAAVAQLEELAVAAHALAELLRAYPVPGTAPIDRTARLLRRFTDAHAPIGKGKLAQAIVQQIGSDRKIANE